MENSLPDSILKKAWEKDVTEEVEEARRETLAYLNKFLEVINSEIEKLKNDKEQIVICMQEADVAKEDMEAYEHNLKQTDMDISCREHLYNVLEGIIRRYQRIWKREQLSEDEQKAERRWLLESMAFLMAMDKNSGYEDICGLILGFR